MTTIQLMENKSLGSGGGGGLSCISSSTPMMDKIGAVMNGGSPDSTTPKDSGLRDEGMRTASPAASVADNHGGGSAPNMYSLKWNTQLLSLQRSLANLWDSGIGTDAVLLCQGMNGFYLIFMKINEFTNFAPFDFLRNPTTST